IFTSSCVEQCKFSYNFCKDAAPNGICPDFYEPIPPAVEPSLSRDFGLVTKWNAVSAKNCTDNSDIGLGNPVWSDWGPCKNGTRTRKCLAKCHGKYEETQKCTGDVIGNWGEWGECVSGKSSRSRTCIGECKGVVLQEFRDCKDYILGDWSEWGDCIDKKQTRSRPCTPGFNSPRANCPLDLTETRECAGNDNSGGPIPIDGTVLPIVIPLALIILVFTIVAGAFWWGGRKVKKDICHEN